MVTPDLPARIEVFVGIALFDVDGIRIPDRVLVRHIIQQLEHQTRSRDIQIALIPGHAVRVGIAAVANTVERDAAKLSGQQSAGGRAGGMRDGIHG